MNTQEERDLTRSLQNQADQFHGSAITLEGVTSRSRSITRRRRMVAGAGVLAAAAILVPAATLFGGQTPANTELPPATEAPSKAPTPIEPTDAAEPEVSHVFTSDVAQGDAPRIAYIAGSMLHRADGSTVELLEGGYREFVTQGDTTLAIKSDNGDGSLYIFDAVGNAAEPFAGVQTVVTSPDHSVAAWIDGTGEVWTYANGKRLSLGKVDKGSKAVAVNGSDSCKEGDEGTGCTVYFNGPGESEPMLRDSHGLTDVAGPGFIKLADAAADGRVMGQTSYADESSCHQITQDSTPVLETCDHVLFQFSPDGTYISANPTSYLDGFGSNGLNILDSKGEDLAWWTNQDEPQKKKDIVYSHVWEDADHVLAISYGRTGWNVLRLGVDGSIEKVLGPSPDDDEVLTPYILEGS